MPAGVGLAGIKPRELRTVVENPAVVAFDIGFGRGALGEDHIVGPELYVEIVDPLDAARLNDRQPIRQLPGRRGNTPSR